VHTRAARTAEFSGALRSVSYQTVQSHDPISLTVIHRRVTPSLTSVVVSSRETAQTNDYKQPCWGHRL